MRDKYLGRVDSEDPLYPTLLSATAAGGGAVFHVWGTDSPRVYRYQKEHSAVSVIGKFKGDRAIGHDGKRHEYDNLMLVRGKGLDRHPYFAVRPLGCDESIDLLLLSEYAAGADLDFFLKECSRNHETHPLSDALSRLAVFLMLLHSRTEEGGNPFASIEGYGAKLVGSLKRDGIINPQEEAGLLLLLDRWRGLPIMGIGKTVLVHGDATPTNFIFAEDGGVAAIDLEMVKRADPVFDLGMVCGEIKHAFLWRNSSRSASEPFIESFLRSYVRQAADRTSAFREITKRLPYFMALTELRIARNHYLTAEYRRLLAREAFACLQYGIGRPC